MGTAVKGVGFYILAMTSLHPGIGRVEAEHVDLPVQRDEFELPTIWSSSLKGAFKSYLEQKHCSKDNKDMCARVHAVFGPSPDMASEFASSVTILDARLLMIPARSLRGVWLYITSRHLISMARLYSEALGLSEKFNFDISNVEKGKIIVSSDKYITTGNKVIINETSFDVATNVKFPEEMLKLKPLEEVKKIVGDVGVAIVNDDDLKTLVRKSLIVQYRVKLKRAAKTVDTGPWSEEYIPPFTIFFSAIHCVKPRSSKVMDIDITSSQPSLKDADDVCNFVKKYIEDSIWLGGKETIGKGLVKVIWL